MTRQTRMALLMGCVLSLLMPLMLWAAQQEKPLTGFVRDSVLWHHIRNSNVVASKVAITSVTVTVSAGAATGSSSAAATLVGGTLLGIRPAGNQDQHVDNVVLNGNGSITVTLAANATAINTFVITVLRTRP